MPPNPAVTWRYQGMQKALVHLRHETCAVLRRIEVADLLAHGQQTVLRERQEAHLRGPQVVEARVVAEAHLHPLIEGREPLQSLVALEEIPRPGDDQVQPGQLVLRQHVHQLAQGV